MFVLIFREMVIITAGLIIIWFLWSQIRKVSRKDARKEHIKEALANIDEILELAKEIPKVDPEKLKAAREKLASLGWKREGSKNGS